MTLEDLRQLLDLAYDAGERTVRVQLDSLGSESAVTVASSWIGDDVVEIQEVDRLQQEGAEVVARGRMDLLGLTGVAAEVRFQPGETGAEFAVFIELPGDWKFSDSFPAASSMVLGEVVVDGAQANHLVVSSHAFRSESLAFDVAAGMNVSVFARAGAGIFEQLAWLFVGVDSLRLAGTLGREDEGLVFDWSLGSHAFAFLGAGRSDNVSCRLFSTVVSEGSGRQAEFGIALALAVDIGGQRLELVDRIAGGSAGVLELATRTEIPLPGATELATFLGEGDVLGFMPGGTASASLSLKELRVGLDTEARTLAYAVVGIGVDGAGWDVEPSGIVPGGVAVERVGVRIVVTSPFAEAGRSVKAFVGGDLMLVGNRFRIAAAWPDFTISADMPTGGVVNLVDLVTLLVPRAADMPDVFLEDLALAVTTSPGAAMSLAGTLESDWSIPLGSATFDVRSVAFDLREDRDGLSGSIVGTFTLAGVDFIVSAEHPRPGEGWRLEGHSGSGQPIPIGDFLTALARELGVEGAVPKPLEELNLGDLAASFDTESKDFSASGLVDLPVAGRDVELFTEIALTRSGEADFSRSIRGEVTVDDLVFDVAFQGDSEDSTFLASFTSEEGVPRNLGDIVAALTDVQALVESGKKIDLTLEDALLVYEREAGAAGQYLAALDMGAGMDLSALPLVGKAFPKDAAMRLVFQPRMASAEFDEAALENIRPLLPERSAALPPGPVAKGLSLGITLRVGSESDELDLPIAVDQASGELAHDSTPTPPSPDGGGVGETDGVRWRKIQRSLGPVHFERVGVRYAESRMSFLLDGSLSAAGLVLGLNGLRASFGLTDLEPTFGLDGIGVDYSNGSMEIGGAFQRRAAEPPQRPYDQYDGAAIVRASEWSLSAIGSYAYVDDHPSLFVYAVLDSPLGGPPFFFVTGLALGFGYNRALVSPAIDAVKTFPLVAEALSASGRTGGGGPLSGDASAKIAEIVSALGDSVPPDPGAYFLAVGVKFTSFKLVDSFALLTIGFGNHVEVDLLGVSTAIVPTPESGKAVPPVAEVQMAFKASFEPEEGLLEVRAQLTSASYLLSRACHLRGGFAFVTWFNDRSGVAGDFVLTLGGYHPHYRVPAGYPKVPRLGFNWRVNDRLSVKGDAYFALTPNAVMAGGQLDATWKDGSLEAWFRAGADFLLAWKPYHYEADAHVDVGVKYTYHFLGTHHVSVDVGADLGIWGPEFAGKARVHLWIVTFTVHFGDASQARPDRLIWSDFKDSFLPGADEVVSLAPRSGLVRTAAADQQGGTPEYWVINPKTFSVATNGVIPVTHVKIGDGAEIDLSSLRYTGSQDERVLTPFVADGEGGEFVQVPRDGDATLEPGAIAIGTMEIASAQSDLKSTVTMTVEQGGHGREWHFGIVPVLKNAPSALWGDDPAPNLRAKALITDTVSGFELVPKVPHRAGATESVERRNLQYAVDGLDDAYRFAPEQAFRVGEGEGREVVARTIKSTPVAGRRRALLKSFGFNDPDGQLHVSDAVAGALLRDPVITAAA